MMMEQKEMSVTLNKTTSDEPKKTTKEEEEEGAITTTTKRAVECIYGSNEDEHNKIHLMRAFVQTQDPSSKDADDLMIRRFLRARNLDIEKASAMFLKYLKWRRTFVPNGFISALEIQHDLAQNKMFLQGMDKKGRPITVAFGGRHFHNKGGLEEFKRCQQDRRSLLLSAILRDGDMQTATFVHTWELYPFCRTTIQKDLGSYLSFMCLTYLWQCGRLYIHLSTTILRRRSCLWRTRN
ncbi:hypothetical protein ACSBR2_042442 [Camellia fascicularis]